MYLILTFNQYWYCKILLQNAIQTNDINNNITAVKQTITSQWIIKLSTKLNSAPWKTGYLQAYNTQVVNTA